VRSSHWGGGGAAAIIAESLSLSSSQSEEFTQHTVYCCCSNLSFQAFQQGSDWWVGWTVLVTVDGKCTVCV